MDSTTIFVLLFSIGCVCLFKLRIPKSSKLPPGPYAFPIIGNILQLGQYPHKSLAKLSKTYGPLMSLYLGTKYAIVVSSPELAKEILQKHDKALSSRDIPAAAQTYNHDKNSIVLLSPGKQWNKLRKICREQLFSTHSLVASEDLRQEKLQKMLDYVQERCAKGKYVDIGEVAFITTLNLMTTTLFSADVTNFGSDSTQEWKQVVEGLLSTVGAPNIADFFPFLKMFDPQGLKREAGKHFKKLLTMLEDIINQRMESRRTLPHPPKNNDFLEVLLDLSEGSEYDQLSCKDIKHLFLDLLVGGSDAIPSTMEWTMTELLHNPKTMSLVKDELRNVIGVDKQIRESDISRLPYLQAVIKEVLRYHPAAPLLVPHKSDSDVEINGYTIPRNTQIFVNVWGMGIDQNLWTNPNSFEPERFLDNKIDLKGQNFELIPFSSGRRMCPGLPLASRMIHVMVGSLVHNFNWELIEPNTEMRKGHTRVKFGSPQHKPVTSLKAIPNNL